MHYDPVCNENMYGVVVVDVVIVVVVVECYYYYIYIYYGWAPWTYPHHWDSRLTAFLTRFDLPLEENDGGPIWDFCCCCNLWLGLVCSPNVTHTHASAPACQETLVNPMVFEHYVFSFSESYWEPHFSYGYGRPSTCSQSCNSTKFIKKPWSRILHIFPTLFECFTLASFDLIFFK